MCASMLRRYGIRTVYFGCWNERFGGTYAARLDGGIEVSNETDLYVTVEPCVMWASMLRQYGIRTVYFFITYRL
jgi:tRNA(Arg) A34 adenosine deaminase TadA